MRTMDYFPSRSLLSVVIFAILLAIFGVRTSEACVFTHIDERRAERKAKRKFKPDDSGYGSLKFEKAMVRFWAKQKRKEKTATCKRKAKKNLVKRLVKVRKIVRQRAANTPRGIWEITLSKEGFTDIVTNLHFSSVNEHNDSLAGTVERPVGNVLTTFSGYENGLRVEIVTRIGEAIVMVYNPSNSNAASGFAVLADRTVMSVSAVRIQGP
ncbi:MAG: hypothetical protein CMO55_01605 [Verrucomicrobiales bacterium]|nr:hypothetical protein [Verrucomicrobiales bacterium]